MRQKSAIPGMRPHDIVVLMKLLLEEGQPWTQISIAKGLRLSQSEVSQSLSRSIYARLLFEKGRKVARQPFMELLQHGVPYIFPQQPGNVVRGIPTAHSAVPLSGLI